MKRTLLYATLLTALCVALSAATLTLSGCSTLGRAINIVKDRIASDSLPGLNHTSWSGNRRARSGKSFGMSLPRMLLPFPSTQHRPSRAICRIVDNHEPPSSHVGAM